MKHCPKCNADKPESEFSKDSARPDGLRGHCKPCSYSYVVASYIRRSGAYAPRVTPIEARNGSAKERFQASITTSRARYPEKEQARIALYNAIRRGAVKRSPCVICDEVKSHGHHEDYTQPLLVLWLCRGHHAQRHAEIKRGIPLNQSFIAQLRRS